MNVRLRDLRLDRAEFLAHDLPPIVFAAFPKTAFARVVESETRAPQHDQNRHEIQPRRVEVRRGRDEQTIDRRADGPQAVHPGIFAADHGENPREPPRG